ncbi:MAG: calcium-binding protein [Rhodobacteraceae bacterium]|nr:calcium-binding protein [Paracoccaceae bacterium]
MKRNPVLAIGFTTMVALGAVISSPVLADANNGPHGNMASGQSTMMAAGGQGGPDHGGGMMPAGGSGMMQMMMQMHSQMKAGGMTGGFGDMRRFDSDGDGTVSQAEAEAGLAAKLAEFDANGDGSLSIAEFETLHSAAIREQMVDRFQALDNDGDGIVTSQEMAAPAARMGQMNNAGTGQGMGSNNATPMHGQNN